MTAFVTAQGLPIVLCVPDENTQTVAGAVAAGVTERRVSMLSNGTDSVVINWSRLSAITVRPTRSMGDPLQRELWNGNLTAVFPFLND